MLTWYIIVSLVSLVMFLSPENQSNRDQLARPEQAGINSAQDLITGNLFLILILSTAMLVPSILFHLIVRDITIANVILTPLLFGIAIVQWNIIYLLTPSRFKR